MNMIKIDCMRLSKINKKYVFKKISQVILNTNTEINPVFGNPKFSIKNIQEDSVVPLEAERTMERNYHVGEISHA